MHLKVFLKLEKTQKNSLFWENKYKKSQKTQKKPTGLVKKKKPGFFLTLLKKDNDP